MSYYTFKTTYMNEHGRIYEERHENMDWEDVSRIIGCNPDTIIDLHCEMTFVDPDEATPSSAKKELAKMVVDMRKEIEDLKLQNMALQVYKKSGEYYEKHFRDLVNHAGSVVKVRDVLKDENQGLKNEIETMETMLKTIVKSGNNHQFGKKPMSVFQCDGVLYFDSDTISDSKGYGKTMSKERFDHIKAMEDDGK